MATILLGAAGAAAGASLGGTALGLSSAVIGRTVGATVGRMIDARLMGAGSAPVEVGRLDRLRLTGAGEGVSVPRLHGRMRVSGQVIWASPFQEHVSSSGSGGKGAPSQPKTRNYRYSVSLAIGLCEGVIARVGRIWADGQEIARDTVAINVYPGDETQLPDPTIEAYSGDGMAPAYRGLAYVVFEDLDLTPFGNRVPQFSFEVVRGEQPDSSPARDLSRHIRGVAMLPGTGEYALATTPVRLGADGDSRYANVNTPAGGTDFTASLQALEGELPLCRATSLIVSWFGDDLRAGQCRVRPMVERNYDDGREMPWASGGIDRGAAEIVPQQNGAAVYGGTPSDQSVIEAIRALREAGQAVTFYPFLLMDQVSGNGLFDPYGGFEQAALPWRGRITLDTAPGRPGSADGTAMADRDVAAFFGTAAPDDFRVQDRRGRYDGPAEWSYRRFILHYAHICAAAGGVEAFCIGSEMRGLTTIRGERGFPAVTELRRLAAECRGILGPETKIGYAADWSEYFGHHPQDGSGDVYFHLDPLWADPAIDFIGIDNYMPLSDWRDGDDHADASWGSIYNLDYLKANIAGGEGFDWYYASDENARAQVRSPISDGAYGEPWVFRYKDLRSWWSNAHHERIGGSRQSTPTAWVPGSKPIWFTEIGCAAIDKGTNQPNKFLDPKSSESALPKFSNGGRDDYIQVQYLRALDEYWADRDANPVSSIYGGPMVDMDRAHVWAWDARPFPQFPGDRSLWSDADNYARGHWITGRSGSRTLASVVAEVCAEAGVTEIDLDDLIGVVRGFAVPELTDARASLQPLMLAFGFDAVERDGRLVFRSRGGRPDAILSADDLAVSDEIDGDLQATRSPEAEEAGRIKLAFVGADGAFETKTTEAIFPGNRDCGVATSDLPVVLTADEGRAVAQRWLAETRVSRDRLRFALPPSRYDLGAGSVIEIAGGHWRIDHVDISDYAIADAVRVERNLYTPPPGIVETIRVPTWRAPTPVLPIFLDLPLLTGDETAHAPHIAIGARPWPGPVTVLASAEDADYRSILEVGSPAVMGVTESPLFRASAGVWDDGPALRVRLSSGHLSSVSELRCLAGANAVAIGSGEDDRWEIFQFCDATLVEGVWEIGKRLRGQAGTDGVMPDVWPAGSRVVFLGAGVPQLPIPPSLRGVLQHFRIGPASRPVSDASFVTETRSFRGVGLRPYAPVHLCANPEGSDLRLSWIRRTRSGGDDWQGMEVPLGETREIYRLRVIRDGVVLRETFPETPIWVYSAADRVSDGPGVRIEVAQASDSWGIGPAARIAV